MLPIAVSILALSLFPVASRATSDRIMTLATRPRVTETAVVVRPRTCSPDRRYCQQTAAVLPAKPAENLSTPPS